MSSKVKNKPRQGNEKEKEEKSPGESLGIAIKKNRPCRREKERNLAWN